VAGIKRTIKSFVRREGRMTPAQKQALDSLWSQYGLETSASTIDFSTIFKNQFPTILEIGFGMGSSLLAIAQEHPENNYIGIEVHRPGVGALLANIATHNLTNIRIYCADAIEVLNQCILDNSLTEIIILFPDPWPKKKHHKRRLIQPKFIELIHSKLQPNGYLHIATDWENYAEHIEQIMTQTKFFKKTTPKPRPETKFEQRGKKLGHKIWDFGFCKI